MRHPIITLLTDFGSRDPYVAAMKGVILGINPQCRLIDITHHVAPQDIQEGAFILAGAFSYYPRGTIHLSVVDPGVGGDRNSILIVTSNYCFVGPDNGLFTLALQKETVKEVLVLNRKEYFSPSVRATFHGRDVFAPVAAHLSRGVKPEALGKRVDTWVTFAVAEPELRSKEMVGTIIHVDAFGNLISNVDEESLKEFTRGFDFSVRIGQTTLYGLKKGYWEGRKGEGMALIGSGGFLEIAVPEGNAQRELKVKRGDPVKVLLRAKKIKGLR